jgi:ABC-type multidrug transport system ATPase subunit
LQDPDSGTIHLDNLNVLDQKDEVRKTLGYLPQEFGVYPKVSAENLLDHFAILKGITKKGERKDVVEALLRQTNLWDVRRQKLGGYSGGMRQRFGVAIALLGNPKLMIVDEPTAGLDPAERVRFLNLLSELGENSAVILSTHIVEDVSELCTRMAIIRKGQILLEAEPMVAVNELQGKIWRRMIDKTALKEIEQQHAVISTKLLAGRTVVHIYSEHDPGNDFDKVEADLEDVYFSTMAGHYGKGCIKQQEVNA